MTDLRKAAQPEQELEGINEVILNSIRDSSEVVAPPQREFIGLTDEEANELTYASIAEIEAKLKEKNT